MPDNELPSMPLFFDETAACVSASLPAAIRCAHDQCVELSQDAGFDNVRKALLQGKAVNFKQGK